MQIDILLNYEIEPINRYIENRCRNLILFISTNLYHHHHHHHHHRVVPLARISLTLSRYFSLSFIASGRSSGLHPVSFHSCCMCVRASRPAFAQPYVGVHTSTSQSGFELVSPCPYPATITITPNV